MHVITGGAYNGKAAWVNKHYQLELKDHVRWLSAYRGDTCPETIMTLDQNMLIFSGVELWVKDWLQQEDLETFRDKGRRIIREWLNWERQADGKKLVVIGSDISKGIVPMEKEMRDYRDTTGWFFQDLVESCSRLDLVWYGIARQLK